MVAGESRILLETRIYQSFKGFQIFFVFITRNCFIFLSCYVKCCIIKELTVNGGKTSTCSYTVA